ncbi:neuroblast differentiation-associated protein AHNAK [Acanthochromis polyacanthus]|uniref:neuroblast differentiation-associated protein AHNAK n=1 Tax=Acanthochromis polyacanthus TaxID=80966 RepID=UPI00223421E1|nr:neuroblast differentiation-associated protein AHNAK [Acanthochromis polyacanthus]
MAFEENTGDSSSFLQDLVLDDSGGKVVIKEITDDTFAAKSGLQAGDEIVAATIQLDHLKKNEVLSILKVLGPYEDNMKVVTKKDLTASAGLGSLGLGLKDSKEVLLKKDLQLNASAETPDVSLDGLSGTLNAAKGLGGEIKGPTLNGDLPSLSLDNFSADTGGNFTVSPTGPDIKTGLDGTLTAPDVNVSAPQLNAPSASLDIDKPEIRTGDLKYKAPKFKMPHFSFPQFQTPKAGVDVSGDVDLPSVSGNVETSNLKLSAPKTDLECPDLELNGPKVGLNGSGVKLDTPNAEIETTSHKIKWPHLKWKGPKAKAPDVDINADLPTADARISATKIDGDLSTPDFDVNLPTAEVKSPDLDVQTPDLDIDGRFGKINWPHKKWKKPKFHGPKADLDGDVDLSPPDFSASKIDGDVNVPNAELNLLNADLRGPDVNAADVNIDAPGRINWPHLKWGKSKVNTPKADLDLNADLSTPDVDLSAPKIDGGIKTPDIDVNLPKASADVKAPDADIDLPSSKIKFPTLKKNKLLFSGTKVKTPDVDIDADVAAPDLKVSSPDAPDIHLTTPNVDAEVPSGKFKWLSLKRPKWSVSGPRVGETDIDLDADVSAPDMNLSAPKIDGEINLPQAELGRQNIAIDSPDVDIEGHTGKFKWLNFKKPKFGTLKGPKADIDADVKVPGLDLKGPDVDVRAADVNLSAPEIAGGIDSPDLNTSMSSADVKGPNMDLKSPDLNLDPPDGKIKLPKFKLPKFKGLNAKGPELDANLTTPDIDTSLDLPEVDLGRQNVVVEAPDLSLSAPKIEGGLDATDLDINLPNADVKGPNMDLKSPDLNLDPPDGKIKLPKFKLPKFKGLNAKGPELDANLTTPDIDTSLDLPEVDLGRQNVVVEAPDLSLSAPKIEGGLDATDLDINLPNADVKGPNMDLKSPDLNLDPPDGKIKLPKFKLPKFKGPKVNGPELDANLTTPDIDTSLDLPEVDLGRQNVVVEAPDLSLPAPKIEGGLDAAGLDINLPNADVKGPNMDLKSPDLNLDPPDGKIKLPKFKLPKFKGPKVNGPELDANLTTPDIDTSLDLPEVDLGRQNVVVEAPDLSLPAPKIEGGLDAAGLDINLPNADVKGPNMDLKSPDLNLDSPDGKIKLPKFKLPKFKGLNAKGPELDANLTTPDIDTSLDLPEVDLGRQNVVVEAPDLSLSAPKIEGGLDATDLDINLPNADLKGPDLPKADLQLPNLNMNGSDLSLSSPKVDGNVSVPNIDSKLPKAELQVPNITGKSPDVADLKGANAQLKTPDLDLEQHLGDFKLPHFKHPKLDLSSPKGDVPSGLPSVDAGIKTPSVNIDTPTADANISVAPVDLSGPKLKGDIEGPNADVKAPNVDTNIEKPKFPHFKFPKFNLGSKKRSSDDENNASHDEGSGVDSETDTEMEVPAFKFHRLPTNSIDGIGEIDDAFGLAKSDTDDKEYVFSKGIRLPIVNATSKTGEKIDIMERLKMAREKAPFGNVSPTEEKTDIGLKFNAPSLDVGGSTETGDPSLVRAGTFKVEKPESELGLVAPEISTSDENDKMSLSLSNMLGLNIKN